MKRVDVREENMELFIGTAREIKSLFDNMEKHYVAFSIFSESPKFTMWKNYGLLIDHEETVGMYPGMRVLSASEVLGLL